MNPFRKKGEVEMYPIQETPEQKKERLVKEKRMANALAVVKIAGLFYVQLWWYAFQWDSVNDTMHTAMMISCATIFVAQTSFYWIKLGWT